MSEDPIVPTADVILRPALERFYALRPSAFPHINLRSGVYWHPFLAYRAQSARMLKRLTTLVQANRLSTAQGNELLEYVASEFDAVPETGQTFAVGELILTRSVSTVAGDLPIGTRFTRNSNLTTQIPLLGAEYETLVAVHFDVGQTTAGPIPVRSRKAGAAANHPILATSRPGSLSTIPVPPHGVTPSTTLFDQTITVVTFSAAGGSDGTDDPYVRAYAKAYAIGQYGPTDAATRFAALRATGVRHLLTYDEVATGKAKILVADESWASSDRWAKGVQQSMYDADLVGYGCVVDVGSVVNLVISIEATVILRDINFAAETTEIDVAIGDAVRDYLDNRRDWNVWNVDSLKGVIARAHAKIFNCSAVVMRDANGDTVSEITSVDFTQQQFHYALANRAMKLTYQGPS
jgi:hypothetical protein